MSIGILFSTVSVARAGVLEVYSTADSSTRMVEHTLSTLPAEWVTYGYDDSVSPWVDAKMVWSSSWYNVCMSGGTEWRPSGESIAPCPPAGWDFMKYSGATDPKVVQATSTNSQPSETRNFFRKKFTIPAGNTVSKALLYFTADNFGKFWVNGNAVLSANDRLDNDGLCNAGPLGGNREGGIYTIDVTSFIQSNNILAGNVYNSAICGTAHPFGIQFFLWIEYAPTVSPTPTGTPLPTATPTITPTPTPTTTPTPTITPTPTPTIGPIKIDGSFISTGNNENDGSGNSGFTFERPVDPNSSGAPLLFEYDPKYLIDFIGLLGESLLNWNEIIAP